MSGSDKSRSERVERLINSGFDVCSPENLAGAERASLLVYSLAVAEDDKELRIAEERGIPTVSRAEYLAFLSSDYKTKISVSGSHGKSTTTAMISKIFCDAGRSPSVLSGAALSEGGEPYIKAGDDYLVFEACEYKDSFLKFSPDASVFLNLDFDHTDYFKSFDDIRRSFLAAIKRSALCVVNKDDGELFSLAAASGSPFISYGIDSDADFRAGNLKSEAGKYSFSVFYKGVKISEISLSVLGRFSVYNALAAFALSYSLGVSENIISPSLSLFPGIERRLEAIARGKNGAPVFYDYAHHPKEIESVILAVRELYRGEISVVFKAHTYSRTKDLFDGFVSALSLADRVYLSEIDAIREDAIEGVDAASLARAIGKGALALEDAEIVERLKSESGAIIIMGAANLDYIKMRILNEENFS